MKKLISLLLSAALLLSLFSACRQPPAAESEPPSPAALNEPSAGELANMVFSRSGRREATETEALNAETDTERLDVYLKQAYGLDADTLEDAAVIRGTGMSAFEIAVMRFSGEDAARAGEDCLKDYLQTRERDFSGYAPAEADLVADGQTRLESVWLGLFICPDPEGAEAAFLRALEGEITSSVLPEPAESGNGVVLPTDPIPESPSATPEPALAPEDILFRLVTEYACPEWKDIDKAWTNTKSGDYAAQIERKYKLTPEQYETGAIAWWAPAGEINGFVEMANYEVAVFLLADEAAAKDMADALNAYLAQKIEWARLAAEEGSQTADGTLEKIELLESAAVVSVGRYAALIVSGDSAALAALAFPRILNSEETDGYAQRYVQQSPNFVTGLDPDMMDPDYPDRVKFTPPGKEDMSLYDTSAIRAAWADGDSSLLSDYDREIYDAAKAVLDAVLADGMTDLEKETAIYAWVVNHVNYDFTHMDIIASTLRTSYTPYGGLVDHTSVCLGYATTFQLLCDLAEVECITVVGASAISLEDHAWNMVKLDGAWYCVDVTWDANYREYGTTSGNPDEWRWFNVTSELMARFDHQWDYANTPEAVTE